MSKMYSLNRMRYGANAGDPFFSGLIGAGAKLLGGLFKKKVPQAIAKVVTSPVGRTVAAGAASGAAWAAGEKLLGGGGGRGASGGWGAPRRAKGITARELRGYRKVANLLHREGMVSRRARGRK
jgi:hypothetical protein